MCSTIPARLLRLVAVAAFSTAVGCAGGPTKAPFDDDGAVTEAGAPPTDAAVRLTVLAAASLTEAFRELAGAYALEHPNASVTPSFGASSDLATQILEGAPADVFASANPRQMQRVVEGGRAAPGDVATFARNRLVVVFPADNPAGITALGDLARPGIKLVLAAPGVPAGAYAREFLARASTRPEHTAAYSPTVLANVVSNEADVRGVLGKVGLGEADAGIVYVSDLMAADAARFGRVEIPDDLNVVAEYPIAPIADGPARAEAERFVAFTLSAEGQAILARFGFTRADGAVR